MGYSFVAAKVPLAGQAILCIILNHISDEQNSISTHFHIFLRHAMEFSTHETAGVRFRHGSGGSALHLSDSPCQSFPFWRVVHVATGCGQYVCGTVGVDVVEGDYLLLCPGDRHLHVRKALRLVYIPFAVEEELAGSLVSTAPICRFAGKGHDRRVLGMAFLDAQRELAKGLRSRRAVLQVRVMLGIFSGEDVREPSVTVHAAESIREAALRMAAHPEQRVSVPQLAHAAGFSTSQFTRLFRQAYGTSPGRYAVKARIRAACRLLNDQGLSVKETAYSLDYPSPFAFSRQFKQERGCAPSEYSDRSRP
jgi:AraC-like DNA-binding protein